MYHCHMVFNISLSGQLTGSGVPVLVCMDQNSCECIFYVFVCVGFCGHIVRSCSVSE